jgi:hypothetical protein
MDHKFDAFFYALYCRLADGLGMPRDFMSTKSTEPKTRRTVSVMALLPRPDSETSRSCFISMAESFRQEANTLASEAEHVEERMRIEGEEKLRTAGLIRRLKDHAGRQAEDIAKWKAWAGHAQHVAVERLNLLEQLGPSARRNITTR